MRKYEFKLRFVLIICLLVLFVNLFIPVKAKAFSFLGYDIPTDFKGIATKTFKKYFFKDKDKKTVKDKGSDFLEKTGKRESKNKLKEKTKEVEDIQPVVVDEKLKEIGAFKDVKDLEVEKRKDGLSKIVVDESTVNHLISKYTKDLEFAGYKIKSIIIDFEKNTIYASTVINEKTSLNITIEVGEDGTSFIIKDISNPSNDISFIRMFILKNILKTIDLDKLQSYIKNESGELEKIVITKNKAEVYVKY